MSKLNLIIGIAIIATFSILFTNVVIEAFSQTVSNNNTKKDAMGNFKNYPTNSSTNNNGNKFIKRLSN